MNGEIYEMFRYGKIPKMETFTLYIESKNCANRIFWEKNCALPLYISTKLRYNGEAIGTKHGNVFS